MKKNLRFALFGTGFWSRYQLAAFAARARAAGVAIETDARGFTSGHLQRYLAVSRQLDARLAA